MACAERNRANNAASEVVARVGEREITFEDIRVLALQNGYDLAKPADVALAVRDATNQELLAAEARRRGYENDPEVQRFVRSRIVERLVRESVDKPGATTAPPSEAEIRGYYEKNVPEFTPPTVAQAQILGLLRRASDPAGFTARLAEVQTALADPKANFAELIKRYSDDPAAQSQGGLTNWIVKGEPSKQYAPALVDAIFNAPDTTKIIGPIADRDWMYFVRVKERRDGKPASFEQARDAIARTLVRRKRLEAYDAFVKSLANTTKVEAWPEKVTATVEATTKSSGPPQGPVRPRP